MRIAPSLLIVLRLCIAVGLAVDAADGQVGFWFVPAFLIAVISDILDGMIARHLHIVTSHLRLLDSCADGLLYGIILFSIWRVHPLVLHIYLAPLLALLMTQVTSWMWCWCKFRRVTSYHSYLAKAWGLALTWMTVRLFLWGESGWSMWLAIFLGMASHFEDALITGSLRRWTYDVPSILTVQRHHGVLPEREIA